MDTESTDDRLSRLSRASLRINESLEFDTGLHELTVHAPRVLTHAALLQRVWGHGAGGRGMVATERCEETPPQAGGRRRRPQAHHHRTPRRLPDGEGGGIGGGDEGGDVERGDVVHYTTVASLSGSSHERTR